jgi:phosphatidate cytidylyltransferase
MRFLLSTEFIQRVMTGLMIGAGFWIVLCYFPPICFSLVLLLILVLIVIFEWTQFFAITKPTFWALLPIYLIIPFGLLISINHSPQYRDLLFILFILVFSFDSGSYITGISVGKTPIWRAISPKKTWEGLIGGYIFAYLGFLFIVWEQSYKAPLLFMGYITLATCTLALLGDLFESFLKRRAHLKDSGNLLPGHGGFLDRFDGIIFAIFFFYFFKDTLIAHLIS